MFGLFFLIDEAYVWTMLDVECVGLCWMLNVLDLMYVRMLNECVCRCGHVLCECVIIPILHVTINLCWIHGDMASTQRGRSGLGESGS